MVEKSKCPKCELAQVKAALAVVGGRPDGTPPAGTLGARLNE